MAVTWLSMVNRSRGLSWKKNFPFICIILISSLLLYFLIQTSDLQRARPAIFNPYKSLNATAYIQSYRRYVEIQQGYNKTLISLPIVSYNPSKSFIDYGKPVKTYLPGNSSKVKRILAWTSFFGDMSYIPLKFGCGNNIRCETTYDKKDLLTSDAILMHARNLDKGVKSLPAKRLPYQRWVYFVMESPYHIGLKPADYNGVFNYTLTYRYDSDAQVKYFSLYKRERPLSNDLYISLFTKIMASKSKLVSVITSNCDTSHSKRLSYILELQKHITIDRYGYCGVLKCKRYSSACEKTMSSYKFYLSMENSHCRDYVTEKAGQSLFNWSAVPIVMGGADPSDYERALPKGSYINTAGFTSPKELAEYLVLLDQNPTLYNRYHEWRKNYTGRIYVYEDAWCNLCRKLNNDSLPVQTYRDFKGWYDQDMCHI